MEPRISLITRGVSKLQRSARFYRDGLDLPLREGSGEEVAFFEIRGTWLSLFPRPELSHDALFPAESAAARGNPFQGFSLAHNVGAHAEVDTTLAEAEAADATIIKPAQDTSWGGYAGYFTLQIG